MCSQRGQTDIARCRIFPKWSEAARKPRSRFCAVRFVNFIYTSCTDTCPLQTADMAKLQEQWMHESDLELVSLSVALRLIDSLIK